MLVVPQITTPPPWKTAVWAAYYNPYLCLLYVVTSRGCGDCDRSKGGNQVMSYKEPKKSAGWVKHTREHYLWDKCQCLLCFFTYIMYIKKGNLHM